MTLPTSDLELKAADERRRLQSSLKELNSRVRETVDFNAAIRQHLLFSSVAVGILAIVAGYSFAGVIVRS